MTENIENKVGNVYNGIRKVVGVSILGALCFVGGYSIAMKNIPSNKNERIQTKNYEVSENSLEKKTEGNVVVHVPEKNHRSVPVKNSLEVISEESLERKAEKTLKESAEKYSDVFSYVRDENSDNYELRMKTDKFSEKEISKFISMRGVFHNKKEGYISFSSRFKDREFYNSMKDLAILFEVCKDDIVSDEEKKFVEKHAPNIYDSLFPFEGKKEKSEIKTEEKKKKDYKQEDHPFIQGLVNLYFNARIKNEEKKWNEEIGKIDIVEGLRKDNNSGDAKKSGNNNKSNDEAPKAPEKN